MAQTISPRLDKIWAEEAKERCAACKESRLNPIPYEEVMVRYREPRGKTKEA